MQSRRLPLHSETGGALVVFQQIDLVLTFGAVLGGSGEWNGALERNSKTFFLMASSAEGTER